MPLQSEELNDNSMYVKSVAVLAQVLCIVSLGPLADSCELIPASRQVELSQQHTGVNVSWSLRHIPAQ
jgi:hypothetical protein